MKNLVTGQVRTLPPPGLEIWRGPSRHTGEEIVVLATFYSRNRKTGNMIQTWILRTDVSPVQALMQGLENATCGTCPLQHKASGGQGLCYVNKFYVNPIYYAWKRGSYPLFDLQQHRRFFQGRTLRIGSFGDPAMVSSAIFKPLIDIASGCTGYTHQWREDYAQEWKSYLMASTETLSGYREAKAAGWRSFRIRCPGDPLMKMERNCPATLEGSQRVYCTQCRACNGAGIAGLSDISVVAHGGLNTPERFVQLSIQGRISPVYSVRNFTPLHSSALFC